MSGLHRNSSHSLLVPNPESGSWYEEINVKEMGDQVGKVPRFQYWRVGTKGASPDSSPDCIAIAPCRPSSRSWLLRVMMIRQYLVVVVVMYGCYEDSTAYIGIECCCYVIYCGFYGDSVWLICKVMLLLGNTSWLLW